MEEPECGHADLAQMSNEWRNAYNEAEQIEMVLPAELRLALIQHAAALTPSDEKSI